ncbi:UNVERIFIED_CONTAM: protein SPA1-RELATED 2 [Sesamum latifolium]|uniref:Protein SPA1-RELATED 2 n=1 Tax=Sesamum latifolium TaxID=2727402 RepID=A0AAW2SNH9_9LAMI
MDEVVGDEVAEPVDAAHIRNKENEFSLKPGSSNTLHEMVTPMVADYSDISNNPYSNILDGEHLDRIGSSEQASVSPRCTNDAVVEELTLRNYDREKLVIVGSSNNRERTQSKQNHWPNLYQIAGGSGISNFHGQTGDKGKGSATSSTWEDEGDGFFSGLIDQTQPLPNYNHNATVDNLPGNDDKGTSADILYSSGGIRTKILSRSGFSEYFIKSTLRGKGVIHKAPAQRGYGTESGVQDHLKSGVVGLENSVAPLDSSAKPHGLHEPCTSLNSDSIGDGINLRDWLVSARNNKNKVERLSLFRQIVNLVDCSHSNGVFLQDLRPSCFKVSGSHQVMYVGSSAHAGITENVTDQDIQKSIHNRNGKRPVHQSMLPFDRHSGKKQRLGENVNFLQRWPQFPSRSGIRSTSINAAEEDSADPLNAGMSSDEQHNAQIESKTQTKLFSYSVPNSLRPFKSSLSCMLEEKWYNSPELYNQESCSFASNVYSLGVLLFELLGSFDSERSHAAAMLDLRHRILPPSFLLENPKEAGFCLWLLHPEPSLRPTTREILQSELMSGIQELSGGELLSSIDKEAGESELLLYFLLSLNEQKQKDVSNLMEQIQRIEADIQEVERRKPRRISVQSSSPQVSCTACRSSYTHGVSPSLDNMSPLSNKETTLISNIKQLESAYFSMRSNIQLSDSNLITRRNGELLQSRENWCTIRKEEAKYNNTDYLGGFFDGLCKYARYRKFKVRGILRSGEFNHLANVICSLSFDRDEDYLAAGVSKKIKIFEFQALSDDSVDIHYPVVEMANKSRLSCICWNSYIRNYLASTDYDGIVKTSKLTYKEKKDIFIADVAEHQNSPPLKPATGQGFSHFIEHSERAWSVDFSQVNPTKLASGSDDRLVKLWSINEKNSLCTIRSNANVCCVQFSADSPHLLAFSSADYMTYCYDLRNVSTPWCILAGHEKTVSYVKFLDAGTLVSASTDNTLKVWDLNKTSSNSLSRDACSLTLRGHTNEKNFVGLSAADGYITCGSETNEVFAYYKSLPMPITAHTFGSIDPITGKETEDDNGQFVSSVCWRRKSNMVVAANSSGCIKLLQMV